MSGKVSGTGGDDKNFFNLEDAKKGFKEIGKGMKAAASHVSEAVGKKGKKASEVKAQTGSEKLHYETIKDEGAALTEKAKGSFSFREEYNKIIKSVNDFFEVFLKKALIDKPLKEEFEASRESIKNDLKSLVDKIKIGSSKAEGAKTEYAKAEDAKAKDSMQKLITDIKNTLKLLSGKIDEKGEPYKRSYDEIRTKLENLNRDLNYFLDKIQIMHGGSKSKEFGPLEKQHDTSWG